MNDITDLDLPTVHQAWSAVMADVREIRKAEKNKAQGYSFRGIDAAMNAVGPVFRKHRVICLPSRIVDAKHRDFTSKNGTLQHEAIVTVEYRVTGPRGDSFTGEAIGESADSSDKATSQAMSVALRTFLLQGLTMPTDDVDPDHNTVDRADPEPEAAPPAPSWQDQGWSDEGERAAQFADLAERSAALPDDLKTKLRAWCRKNNATPEGLTFEVATAWAAALSKAENPEPEGTVTDPKEQGWKSAAERKRTFKSLHERLGALPAYKAETVQGQLPSIGITGAEDDFTKQQSIDLLALITEAEDLAKEDPS